MLCLVENDPLVTPGLYGTLLRDWQIPYRIWRPYAGELRPLSQDFGTAIVLGGSMGVHDREQHPFLDTVRSFMLETLQTETPLLGICLGAQLLASVAGGEVNSRSRGERGLTHVTLTEAGRLDPLFAGFAPDFEFFSWHNDSFVIPPGTLHLAASATCAGQAFRAGNAWGVQFHPEIDESLLASWAAFSPEALAHLPTLRIGASTLRLAGERLLRNFLQFSS